MYAIVACETYENGVRSELVNNVCLVWSRGYSVSSNGNELQLW